MPQPETITEYEEYSAAKPYTIIADDGGFYRKIDNGTWLCYAATSRINDTISDKELAGTRRDVVH